MGTRADFYIGRGENAEWLGSIAWDGDPAGIPASVLAAPWERRFRDAVAKLLQRDDGTTPNLGWPWPWADSTTTDYAYAYDDGKIWCSNFGREWFDPQLPEPEPGHPKSAVFPDMSERQVVTLGKRSGVIIYRGHP